jgi:hypothetical protein
MSYRFLNYLQMFVQWRFCQTFITWSDNVGHWIPSHPSMFKELRKDTVLCSEPTGFCLDLFMIRGSFRTTLSSVTNLFQVFLKKTPSYKFPFMHSSTIRSINNFSICGGNSFWVFGIIQLGCHLIYICNFDSSNSIFQPSTL